MAFNFQKTKEQIAQDIEHLNVQLERARVAETIAVTKKMLDALEQGDFIPMINCPIGAPYLSHMFPGGSQLGFIWDYEKNENALVISPEEDVMTRAYLDPRILEMIDRAMPRFRYVRWFSGGIENWMFERIGPGMWTGVPVHTNDQQLVFKSYHQVVEKILERQNAFPYKRFKR